jgi:chorismate mutase
MKMMSPDEIRSQIRELREELVGAGNDERQSILDAIGKLKAQLMARK